MHQHPLHCAVCTPPSSRAQRPPTSRPLPHLMTPAHALCAGLTVPHSVSLDSADEALVCSRIICALCLRRRRRSDPGNGCWGVRGGVCRCWAGVSPGPRARGRCVSAPGACGDVFAQEGAGAGDVLQRLTTVGGAPPFVAKEHFSEPSVQQDFNVNPSLPSSLPIAARQKDLGPSSVVASIKSPW